mgnify:CR=1 FL=1
MGENTHQNCTRQNKNKENPGRQQACWGFLIRCTKLTQPTGALDSKATDSLLRLFNRINEEGQTILMVTHSTKAASHANRVLFIKDGQVFHQIYRGNLTNDELYVKIQDALMLITTGGEKHE